MNVWNTVRVRKAMREMLEQIREKRLLRSLGRTVEVLIKEEHERLGLSESVSNSEVSSFLTQNKNVTVVSSSSAVLIQKQKQAPLPEQSPEISILPQHVDSVDFQLPFTEENKS